MVNWEAMRSSWRLAATLPVSKGRIPRRTCRSMARHSASSRLYIQALNQSGWTGKAVFLSAGRSSIRRSIMRIRLVLPLPQSPKTPITSGVSVVGSATMSARVWA